MTRRRRLRSLFILSAAIAVIMAGATPWLQEAYATQIRLESDQATRLGGTGLRVVTKYPVYVESFRLLLGGSESSDTFDSIEVTLRLLDPAYSGVYTITIYLEMRDAQGNTVLIATGSIDVTLGLTPVTLVGSLPSPVNQDDVVIMFVSADKR